MNISAPPAPDVLRVAHLHTNLTWGGGESQLLALAIRLQPGTSLDENAVRAHVAEHMAAFKVPARIMFFDTDLPRNPSGKLLRRTLREQVERGDKA